MKEGETIAVVHTAFSWSMDPAEPSGVKCALTFYGDQPAGEIKTNPKRKRGTIVGDDMPALLRTVADFMEQEGMSSLDDVPAHLAGGGS